MGDVIRRQREEIEKLKNDERRTKNINQALYKGIFIGLYTVLIVTFNMLVNLKSK